MFGNLWALYGPRAARTIVTLLVESNYGVWRFLRSYWHTQRFTALDGSGSKTWPKQVRTLRWLCQLGMLAELLLGLWLLYQGIWQNMAGGVAFGAAIILAYPLVWAHIVAAVALVRKLTRPKKFGRDIVCTILESQAVRLRAKYQFTVVAVAGSVGKTSTKLAVAGVLAGTKRVMYEAGNYNDRVTVPLVLFGRREPSLFNVLAWAAIFWHNERLIARGYPYDVAVLELGTDGPGQIAQFAYLKPDVTVVTAIAPEHMEFFDSLDAVAHEELGVAAYSKQLLVNRDDIEPAYLADVPHFVGYGLHPSHDYFAICHKEHDLGSQAVSFHLSGDTVLEAHIRYLGAHGAKIALAAVAVADMLGVPHGDIAAGVEQLQPFAGRMQILPGLQDSWLIDDTYNASPAAVEAALTVLYGAKTNQRIAVLGSMNELGATSRAAHKAVGAACDPRKLNLVVTIGKDAQKYLAPAAKRRGCTVKTCRSPYEAGEYVKSQLKSGAVVLVKGSQNGVFAEEAVKILLADPADAPKLVRQSAYWRRIKRQQFGRA